MLKKLELDALRADLTSVESLLADRRNDPVGTLQFSHRRDELRTKLDELEREPVGDSAGVALFFGGRPVVGSRGIQADFGTQAISSFQSLVATRFAELEGPVGRRGPVSQRAQTQLMITDVARGSMGFVLEEFGDNRQLLDTPLKDVVDEVCSFIYRLSSPDEEAFHTVTDVVDDRLLGSLRQFFQLLDEQGATLRVVENSGEFTLGRDDVERAHERTDNLRLTESEQTLRGTLYILPDARKFEAHIVGGETIRGSISRAAMQNMVGDNNEVRGEMIGALKNLQVRVKEARVLDHEPRRSYTLINVLPD